MSANRKKTSGKSLKFPSSFLCCAGFRGEGPARPPCLPGWGSGSRLFALWLPGDMSYNNIWKIFHPLWEEAGQTVLLTCSKRFDCGGSSCQLRSQERGERARERKRERGERERWEEGIEWMVFIDPKLGNSTVADIQETFTSIYMQSNKSRHTETVNCAEVGTSKVSETTESPEYYPSCSGGEPERGMAQGRKDFLKRSFRLTNWSGRKRRKSASYRKRSDLTRSCYISAWSRHLTYFWTVLILVTHEIQMQDRK